MITDQFLPFLNNVNKYRFFSIPTYNTDIDAAWEDIVMANCQANATALRALMAGWIMAAIRDGERNSEVLKKLAVEAFANTSQTHSR